MNEKPEALRVADELKQHSGMAALTLRQHESAWEAARLLREQHEEIERLRAEREEDQGVIAVWRGRTQRAEAEIERLRIVNLEHEILRRDRARMNWIEANLGRFRVTDNGFVFVEVNGRHAGGNDLREALDAAMEEERKP